MTNPQLTIGFIGAGKCGTALAKALSDAGYIVRGVASRSTESGSKLAAALPDAEPMASEQLVAQCNLVFITTPDDHIKDIVEEQLWRNGQYVVYCSGALELSQLDYILELGALRGCFHPLQTFSTASQANSLRDVSIGVEADSPLSIVLEQMVNRLGASVIRLAGINRARYHAAAVFASNYVIALHGAAKRIWESAGLSPESALKALSPLTTGAMENLKQLSLEQALTGPIARGDIVSIKSQLAILSATPDLHKLYRDLGAELLNLELGHGDTTKALLEKLFKDESSL